MRKDYTIRNDLSAAEVREIIKLHGLPHAEFVIEQHLSQHGSESVIEAKVEWNLQANAKE